MAATSTFTEIEEPMQASIEKIPLEILDKIFAFSSDGDCDLSLALTSRSMAMKLRHHHIVRSLIALTEREQVRSIFHEYIQPGAPASCRFAFHLLETIADDTTASRDAVVKANWCTASFVGRLQIKLIKRVLKTYWDPLLARDWYQPSAVSHEYIFAELEDFERNPTALRDEWLIESRVDAVRGRYPWSRVYIWPRQGRVLIRDQFLNSSSMYCVSLLESFSRTREQELSA